MYNLLYLKKKYTRLLNEIRDITNTHNLTEINSIINYNMLIEQVTNYISYLNDIIIENCCHQFIEDEIDITPDKSQKIKYCAICEYTEP